MARSPRRGKPSGAIINGVFITQDRLPQLRRTVTLISQRDVLVGVPAEDTIRTLDPTEPITNAALAYIHDNGAPEINIPARPFMVPGIMNARATIESYFAQAAQAALSGNFDLAMRALHAAGLTAQTAIRDKIYTGPFLPLAPATLAARRARGRQGTRPLLDTAQMRNAITYVIRNRGGNGVP